MQQTAHDYASLELWGGVECTVNRVGEQYFDQLVWSGHNRRLDDLDRFAALGLRALRYPLLWEHIAPQGVEAADWRWADERMARLRELKLRPIVGLVHHGSGPQHTNLLDPQFVEGLASYAGAVAQRYPWLSDYTPVNEPLTTARFSGLYGHWYPHARDDRSFVYALLHECRATVLAMRAIRQVNPEARLVQTEDLGKVFSTPLLQFQADFENERRWLSFDLLCGRVNREHPLWEYLVLAGAQERDLLWFAENPCPPDLLGLNTYLTSQRFLDERIEHYPPETVGRHREPAYADVAAVHVRAAGLAGHHELLAEAWQRYQLPLAITETHLGCTREEQLRWLLGTWQGAEQARSEGVDVRAVTIWALLGSYDWNSLVTRTQGEYEPGTFDLRGPEPRPTALAGLARELATGSAPSHPVLAGQGWWERDQRFCFGCRDTNNHAGQALVQRQLVNPQPLLIMGARGTLGQALERICQLRGLNTVMLTRQDVDITDVTALQALVERHRPWAVVNAAGYVRVDDAEREAEQCMRENARGARALAEVCAAHGVRLLSFSSDLVFDGAQDVPYVESNVPAPLNVYGQSKLEAEQLVMTALPTALMIRTSAFFGPWDSHNFVTRALEALAVGEQWRAADDAIVSPTYVPDLVNACLDLLIDGESGIWHLANVGAISWAELARTAAHMASIDAGGVVGMATAELGHVARRPLYSVLGSERGMLLPDLESALARYLAESEGNWRAENLELALGQR